MTRTLHLVSPLAHGEDVRVAQKLLVANVFGQDFQPGPIDGQFGQQTARACIRAKYWLGYPVAKQKPTFGDELARYLQGTELPVGFQQLREERQNGAKDVPLRELALAEAKRHLGEKEAPPGSNHTPF